MSYATVEAAVSAVIQKHADFDSDNVSQGDASPIRNGLERVVRILYGGHRREEITIRSILDTWTTNIDLYVPWRGNLADLETQFHTEFQKIVDTIEAWPNLDACSGVIASALVNASSPEPLKVQETSYRAQRLILETKEVVTPTRSE